MAAAGVPMAQLPHSKRVPAHYAPGQTSGDLCGCSQVVESLPISCCTKAVLRKHVTQPTPDAFIKRKATSARSWQRTLHRALCALHPTRMFTLNVWLPRSRGSHSDLQGAQWPRHPARRCGARQW